MREHFIDDVKIFVKGGDGGNGCSSFRREKGVPRGGPDGGNGGQGGNIILNVSHSESDLLQFKFKAHFKAKRGTHGQGSRKEGRCAEDLIINVPPGTIVYSAETSEPLADLTQEGQSFIAAKGGRGGRGNTSFANAFRRVPNFSEKGEVGEERWLRLVLKILADIGIIGFPNAGKSSLLSKITAANPKIASYPFTTISPNLGVAQKNGGMVVLADVPGLIEGAHDGLGLGLLFLKHIERTRILLHLIDASSPKFQSSPLEYYSLIKNELTLYNESLAQRPEITVFNKTDMVEDTELLKNIAKEFKQNGIKPLFISCKTGEGLEELLNKIFELSETTPYIEEIVEIKELTEIPKIDFTVKKVSDYFVVEGKMIEKLVNMMDLDNHEAVTYLQKRLKRLGVQDRLLSAGAVEGNIVVIGENEFDFSPDI